MEQAELAALASRARAAFGKLPGVAGVDIALRRTGGALLEARAVKIFVREKKPLDLLPPEERIPPEFEGLPTDVEVVRRVTQLAAEDREPHDPLIGGITITNFHPVPQGFEVGTLGFFATVDGLSGPKNVVLVSNQHVLAGGGGKAGDTIHNPQWKQISGVWNMIIGTGSVAVNHDIGFKTNKKFTYPDRDEAEYYLDCATALLNICISSWCDSNCGVSYKNEQRDLNLGNNKLKGISRVLESHVNTAYRVYKAGGKTGRTEGKVIGAFSPTGVATNVIMIQFTSGPPGITGFVDHGDSGSALVDKDNNLVGLVFGRDTDDHSIGYACHIAPVIEYLKIKPITEANPPVPPAGQARLDARGFTDGINETAALRERFLKAPAGARVYAEILAHRAEIVALVNHCRPVTLAWHRSQGPAFVAHGIENARNSGHLIPRQIEGIGREELARRMARALSDHGSPQLKRAMEEWLPFVLAYGMDQDSLHDLVDTLPLELADD